jgi:hypothetical protein
VLFFLLCSFCPRHAAWFFFGSVRLAVCRNGMAAAVRRPFSSVRACCWVPEPGAPSFGGLLSRLSGAPPLSPPPHREAIQHTVPHPAQVTFVLFVLRAGKGFDYNLGAVEGGGSVSLRLDVVVADTRPSGHLAPREREPVLPTREHDMGTTARRRRSPTAPARSRPPACGTPTSWARATAPA